MQRILAALALAAIAACTPFANLDEPVYSTLDDADTGGTEDVADGGADGTEGDSDLILDADSGQEEVGVDVEVDAEDTRLPGDTAADTDVQEDVPADVEEDTSVADAPEDTADAVSEDTSADAPDDTTMDADPDVPADTGMDDTGPDADMDVADTACTSYAWVIDGDGDGFGDKFASPIDGCEAPADGNDYVLDATDCDDANGDVNPGADEQCDDTDWDCDGDPINGLPADVYYADADRDGYGNPDASVTACADPTTAQLAYVSDNTDCNDNVWEIHPGVMEQCDEFDRDCDPTGSPFNGFPTQTYYRDMDGDGFGDPLAPFEFCALPAGYVENQDDCDDSSDQAFPRLREVSFDLATCAIGDQCNDGLDNDCDGAIDALDWECQDRDGDNVPNAVDPIDKVDLSTLCVNMEAVFPEAYASYPAVRQGNPSSATNLDDVAHSYWFGYRELAPTLLPMECGETPDSHGFHQCCYDASIEMTERVVTHDWRVVSTQSAADASVAVDPLDCNDWVFPDLTCQVDTGLLHKFYFQNSSTRDLCNRYVGDVLYFHWRYYNGTILDTSLTGFL